MEWEVDKRDTLRWFMVALTLIAAVKARRDGGRFFAGEGHKRALGVGGGLEVSSSKTL